MKDGGDAEGFDVRAPTVLQLAREQFGSICTKLVPCSSG
jgi:hypothetical protein